ncbi:hypothetical protein [Caulobacter sp. LARHSG274]
MLDDGWRPDRSGLLIVFDEEHIPPSYEERVGLKFILFGSLAALLNVKTMQYLAALIHAEVPVFLSVPGPPEHHLAKAFLNDRLKAAVERRDGGEIAALLTGIYTGLRHGEFEPVRLLHARASGGGLRQGRHGSLPRPPDGPASRSPLRGQ